MGTVSRIGWRDEAQEHASKMLVRIRRQTLRDVLRGMTMEEMRSALRGMTLSDPVVLWKLQDVVKETVNGYADLLAGVGIARDGDPGGDDRWGGDPDGDRR